MDFKVPSSLFINPFLSSLSSKLRYFNWEETSFNSLWPGVLKWQSWTEQAGEQGWISLLSKEFFLRHLHICLYLYTGNVISQNLLLTLYRRPARGFVEFLNSNWISHVPIVANVSMSQKELFSDLSSKDFYWIFQCWRLILLKERSA